MRSNPMKAALARGEMQVGTWINMVRNPAILTLMKAAGLDFARVDMEHAPTSLETVADMALVSRALEFPIIVRPPSADREWVSRLLDAGVWGLHVPGIESVEQAAALADAALFAPAGSRGMAPIGPQTDYEDRDASTQEFMNRQTHLTVMFESERTFEHLEAIAALPGIDALGVGPTDLAQSLGVFGKPEQAEVVGRYQARLLEVATAHGKDVSVLVRTVEEGARHIARGARIICYASESDLLRHALTDAAARLHAAARPPA